MGMTEIEKYSVHFPGTRMVKKARPGKCPLWGCRLDAKIKGLLCPRHSMRLWRATKPLQAHFAQIKDRAVRRGQVFTLTRQQFIELVVDTGYMEQRGRSPSCLHIDRKDPNLGYEHGNVRVITARENCQKAHEDKQRRREHVEKKWSDRTEYEINDWPNRSIQEHTDENPF